MPAPRRGGTAVAVLEEIFWSPFCYLPQYLPPHVMTTHECYEIESYYRGLLMPFVTVPLSLVGCQMVARWMQGDVDPIETQEPKAEVHARALRHAMFIIQLHRSGDPDQLATAYELVFKDFSAEQVGAIADRLTDALRH